MRSDLARTADASTYALRVTINAVTETLTSASLTADRYYWLSGDAQADASTNGGVGDLAKILKTLLDTHSQVGAGTTVGVSATNRITISRANNMAILWGNGATTLNAVPFGWTQGDTSSSTSIAAPNQTRGAWAPQILPTVDSRDRRRITGGATVSLSGRQRFSRLVEAASTRDLSFELLLARYALSEFADATEPTGTLEDAWRYALTYGRPIRYYADASSRTSTSYGLYVLDGDRYDGARESLIERDGRAPQTRWAARLPLRAYA
jgi:hypothetical protein